MKNLHMGRGDVAHPSEEQYVDYNVYGRIFTCGYSLDMCLSIEKVNCAPQLTHQVFGGSATAKIRTKSASTRQVGVALDRAC